MNRCLILISKKPIVIQIFTLVCKKLKIKLEVLNEAQVDHEVDILVVDSDFIDDRFNILKRYTSLIGAISKEDLPFELANDFLIPLPFLPSSFLPLLLLFTSFWSTIYWGKEANPYYLTHGFTVILTVFRKSVCSASCLFSSSNTQGKPSFYRPRPH